jgi:hypothetical protein
MLALELAVSFLLGLGLLQRHKLGLGKHQAILGALGFQCLERLALGLKVVAQRDTAHVGGRDRDPST